MTAVIHINGVIGEDILLKDVIRQFKSFKKPSEVVVNIDSPGGEVEEGMAIFNYFRSLATEKGLNITTKASKAYSIAASIFMAGDIRLLEEGSNRFMIHNPWGQAKGGAEDFEQFARELREIEDHFTAFYSTYTDIDGASIKRLLKNETFLSASEAVELQLATGTYSTLKAVAFYNNNEPKTEETIMTKAEKLALALASFIKGEEKPTEETAEVNVVALVLQDANGESVEFPELDENMTPEAGSKITKDGEPFEGEVLMPDGSKIIAFNGIVEEIVPATEEEEAPAEQPAQEEAVAQEEVEEEEEVDFTALFAQMEAKIMDKVRAEHKEEKEALNAEILALKKEIGSSIDNDPAPAKINDPKSGNFLTNALKNRRK